MSKGTKSRADPSRTDRPAEERLLQAARLVREERYEEALPLLQVLADAGMPQAQVLLGWLFDQERAWVRAEGTEVGSYEEAVCELFDDQRFDAVVETRWREAGLPEHALPSLRAFRDALSTFNDRTGLQPTPEAVLSDPEWQRVVDLAKRVIEVLDENGD